MPKALTFKGDKKPSKKRKRPEEPSADDGTTVTSLTRPNEPPAEAPEDDTWVSADTFTDLSGPILLVLPTSPPHALACDQLGAVFASKLENLVEGNPASAEPHDVRQVFVATRVVGSDGDVVFKGCNGRYLGCDKVGILSVEREAISPEETWTCEANESGVFRLKTARGKCVGVDGEREKPGVRGDVEAVEGEDLPESTVIRIRMQARFKPKLKVEKAEKVRAKISRKELEDEVGRRLEDDEVKKLKRARKEGNFHEAMLDVKVKGKHDKFA
ncbi:hypothetical protein B0A48_12512 [Cryoendolithus antarcticus]|uniref:Uncharacterized protein n=1 Tax=Cryoendolithus antarcticus TaxID=1507870 RepID=A0A1V8SSK0_9PEZI|nr:hypothetical protein B0A48_12512 [Cryoendolithus antarcticus]